MDREFEALEKARVEVERVSRLSEMAEEHLREGRFEDARACLLLIRAHADAGGDALGLVAEQ